MQTLYNFIPFFSLMNKLKIEITAAVSTLFLWIGIGTIAFRHLEPWSWITSFYFSVVTITTVGYGDLAPSSDMSRLFTAFYILIGVSIGIGALGLIGAELIKKRENTFFEKWIKKEKE